MTRVCLQIAPPATKLHFYRHLLREASYLPPFARPCIDEIIKKRFRHKLREEPSESRLRNARRSLRYLRAANMGDLDSMRRIILLVFGRTGERRRRLMETYFVKRISADGAEKAKISQEGLQRALDGRPRDWLDRWDLDKLEALVRSQAEVVHVGILRAQIKVKDLETKRYIPALTSWGRPPTKKAARNKMLKQWKRILAKLLPPIPRGEWERLRDLALGKEVDRRWAEPRRRPVARSLASEEAFSGLLDWNWQAYATQRVARVDRQGGRRYKLRSGVVDDELPGGDPPPIGKHKLSPHLWQRLLMQVWQLCPVMEPELSAQKGWRKWKFTWGEKTFEPSVPPASADFFRTLPQARAAGASK